MHWFRERDVQNASERLTAAFWCARDALGLTRGRVEGISVENKEQIMPNLNHAVGDHMPFRAVYIFVSVSLNCEAEPTVVADHFASFSILLSLPYLRVHGTTVHQSYKGLYWGITNYN